MPSSKSYTQFGKMFMCMDPSEKSLVFTEQACITDLVLFLLNTVSSPFMKQLPVSYYIMSKPSLILSGAFPQAAAGYFPL